MTEREIQDLLREMREETVPADSLARVRMGVDQRIRRRVVPWKALAVLAVAACLIAGWFFRPRNPVKPVGTVEIAQVIPSAEIPGVPPESPVRAVSHPRRARRLQRVEAVPVLIRIETPDPDVVILLVN